MASNVLNNYRQFGKLNNPCMPDKELRQQLQQEIELKSKSCSNPTFDCTIPRIEGHDYCLRHILRDPHGGYRQCTYVYLNGKKCPNALPRHDTKKDPALTTLCFEHSRQIQLQKTRAAVGKLRRVENNDTLLNSLAHHLHVEEAPATAPVCEQDEVIDVVSPHVAPFVNHDQIHDLSTVANTVRKRRRVLDYASDTSSENEPLCLQNTARGFECDSDNESTDSEDGDYLRHAGIYTRQEAIRISEDKLSKLQRLYMSQMQRLNHMLRERRRRYLHSIRKEREVYCSIYAQAKDTPAEMDLYAKFKALNTYHHRHGTEAVLFRKFKEKRSRTTDNYANKGPGYPRCVFTEGGVKCGERSLPCCKYCRKHILEDKKQTLFRACSVEKSGVVCAEPVPFIFDDATCVLHLTIPAKRQYIQKKCESETEEEEVEIKREILNAVPSLLQPQLPTDLDAVKVELVEMDAAQTSPTPPQGGSGNVTIAHETIAKAEELNLE